MNTIPHLARLLKFLPLLEEQHTGGRVDAIQYGKVVAHTIQLNTATSQHSRRVRVSTEGMAGQSASYDVEDGRKTSFTDEPLTPIGTRVLIGFANGDPTRGAILRTADDDTNPPDTAQNNPALDNTTAIPGDEQHLIAGEKYHEVGKNEERKTKGNLTITAEGEQLLIETPNGIIKVNATGVGGEVLIEGGFRVQLRQGGASLEGVGGMWTLRNAAGQKMTMGSESGEGKGWELDLAGGDFSLINGNNVEINADNVTINGLDAVTVTGQDTDGDTINYKGDY